MIRFALVTVAALAIAGSAAAAPKNPVGANGVVASKNGSRTIATSPVRQGITKYERHLPPGETTIYDNIAEAYPDGLYNCCSGWTVSGPSSLIGEQFWLAAAFTPSTDVTADMVELGIGYVTGAVNGVKVSINEDAGGVPGDEIAVFPNVDNLPSFGSCCVVMSARTHKGAALTAGTQYWVTVTTRQKEADEWAAWNEETTEQITPQTAAGNTGTGWQPTTLLPSVAFAVFGK